MRRPRHNYKSHVPKYYYLNFNDLDSKNNTSIDFKNRISVFDLAKLSSLSLLYAVGIFIVLCGLTEDKEKAIKLSLLTTFIIFCASLKSVFNANHYRLRAFNQAYLENSDHKKISDAYFIFQKKHPNFLKDFMKMKDLSTLEDFISYYRQVSNRGLCTGYTHEILRQIALHPAAEPVMLLDRLEMREIIKHQLFEHIRRQLIKYHFSEIGGIHICYSTCPCRSLKELEIKNRDLPRIVAANTLYAQIEGQGVFKWQVLKDFFTRHLQGLGFVPPERLCAYGGNHPVQELDDEIVMTSKELEEKRLKPKQMKKSNTSLPLLWSAMNFMRKEKEFIQRKIEYIDKNRKAINLAKYTVAGKIITSNGKEGHTMLYKFAKRHILFFDSNHGLYQYPSSKVFCQQLASHLKSMYANTEQVSLITYLFKAK